MKSYILKLQDKLYGSITEEFLKKNIPVLVLCANPFVAQAGLGYKQQRFRRSNLNTSVGHIIANNKRVANKFLAENDVPVPIGSAVRSEKELSEVLKQVKFPIVIKPSENTMGGTGVAVNIQDPKAALMAFKEARQKAPQSKYILVEEMVLGDDIRVFVLNGKVEGIIKRRAAEVIGDGKSTARDLILAENIRRKPKIRKNVFHLLPIDSETDNTLVKQGYSLDSVIPTNVVLRLRNNSNISTGGLATGLAPADINPEIKSMCERIARLLGMKSIGIDILTTDNNKPLSETGGKVIEVNALPVVNVLAHPQEGTAVDIPLLISEFLQPKENNTWIDIKINGQTCHDYKTLKQNFGKTPKKVKQFESLSSKNRKIIKNPPYKLITYLFDPLTISIEV